MVAVLSYPIGTVQVMAPINRSHLRLVGAPGPVHSEHGRAGSRDAVVVIDCEVCVRQHTDECDDCVVSYLVDHDPATPVTLGREEQRAVELLADAGLVPPSRFEPGHGVA